MFDAYKRAPTTDNLIHLLRATQDRVYRLCFHVLRRPHDAEDAAQEVLIKIVDGIRGIDDSEQFNRWVYRVSLNAALETIRKAARRRDHESRAAMSVPTEPLDEESRLALFEGIAGLDDASRSLLLDHYFDGRTLESIASRDGVSPQAASKRLEKAREELKRALPVGFLALPDLGGLFPRGASPSTAPDLVSGAVLAKVHSIAALAAGGTIVATKSSIAAVVAFSLIACLGAGTGAVLLLRSSPDPKPSIPVPAKVEPNAPGTSSVQTGSPKATNEDDARRAVAAAKRRIMEAFAKHYSALSAFAPIRKDRSNAMFLRQLIENKDLRSLAASIAGDESGHSLTALRELFETSKSELRDFSLLLLAQSGRAEDESLFLGIMRAGKDDPVGSALAAFGLGTIGSPTAMETLAAGFRASLYDAGGKPDWTLLNALYLRPAAGLPHLVAIAEELVGMGRTTLQEFRAMGSGFPWDASVADQLRLLAETHAFPGIRMLALRPLIGHMRSKEDLATFDSALSREKDPAVRAEILKMTKECVVRGDLKAMEGEARRVLGRAFASEFGADQGARMKFFLKLVPEDEMGLARDVLLGKPAAGVDVEKLDAILFEELPSVTSEVSRRLMLDYALKMGVEDCLNPLNTLAWIEPLKDERFIEPLIDLVQRVDAGRSRAHMATAIRTLTGFSEEFRPRILAQLESLYAGTRKPEVRAAVLEWGFARMGPAGEEVLIKEAASASDPSCRIAAWCMLQRTGALERKSDLQPEAKQFLKAWNPPADGGVSGASAVQARYYAELFASIYMHTGTVEDLPILKKMSENPALAGADPRLLESLGRSATAAAEMIELRARMN